MTRFLSLAFLLGIVQLVVGAAVNAAVFRKVDLRFHAFLALAVVPSFQAAVYMWVRRDPASRAVIAAPRAFRDRFVLAVAVVDLAVLAVSLHHPWIFGVHAIIASLVMVRGAAGFSPPERAGGLKPAAPLIALGLALYGVSCFTHWLAALPDLLGDSAKVLRWAAVYVPLFVIAMAVLLRFAAKLKPHALVAAGWVEIAVALLLVAALVVVSNVFFHPFLREPWATLQKVLAYTSVTALLISALSMKAGDAA